MLTIEKDNAAAERFRSLVAEHVKPLEHDPANFRECWPTLGREGLFGLLSQAYRCQDMRYLEDYLTLLPVLCAVPISGFMLSFLSQGWIIECLRMLSNDAYHENALDGCAKGEKVGAFCLTEPSYGSSYGNLATTATRNGSDGWDIVGEKIYITNAAFADYFVVVANTSGDSGKQGISLFLLERSMVEIQEVIDFVGNRHSGISRVKINCKGLPDYHLLGSLGGGFYTLPKCLNFERMDISLFSVFLAGECLARAKAFLAKRANQTEKILDYQVVRHGLVDMHSQIEVMRTYVVSVAQKLVGKTDCTKDILISKISATEMAAEVSLKASRLTGAYGFTENSGLMTMFNDISALTIGAGANDVLRNALFRYAKRG